MLARHLHTIGQGPSILRGPVPFHLYRLTGNDPFTPHGSKTNTAKCPRTGLPSSFDLKRYAVRSNPAPHPHLCLYDAGAVSTLCRSTAHASRTTLWVLKFEVHNMGDPDGGASIRWLRDPNTKPGWVYRSVHPKAYVFDPVKGTSWIKEVLVLERKAHEDWYDVVKHKFEW